MRASRVLPNSIRELGVAPLSPPRPTAHLGNADMIQPGLIPLQPNLDFMDSFEPFQGEDAGRGGEFSQGCVPFPL